MADDQTHPAHQQSHHGKRPWFKRPLIIIPGIIVVLLLLIGGIGYTKLFGARDLDPATLQIIAGEVSVDTGSGYQLATEEMRLGQEDKVRTGSDGKAIVILYESSIVRLDPSSEIQIAELSPESQKIKQNSGSVWNKITRLGGLQHYAVETPTTTATVRGTGFQTVVGELFELLVYDSTVNAANGNYDRDVSAPGKAVGDASQLNPAELSEEDRAAILEQLTFELQIMRQLREDEVFSNTATIEWGKEKYNVTDEQIKQSLLDLDDSRDDSALDQFPQTPSVVRVRGFNQEIWKVLDLIVQYQVPEGDASAGNSTDVAS